MSDDDSKPQTEAVIFDSEDDFDRYVEIGQQVCKLLSDKGLSDPELIPFLGFYLAHAMDAHLHCDASMFANNMREFIRFTVCMFERTYNGDEDGSPTIVH